MPRFYLKKIKFSSANFNYRQYITIWACQIISDSVFLYIFLVEHTSNTFVKHNYTMKMNKHATIFLPKKSTNQPYSHSGSKHHVCVLLIVAPVEKNNRELLARALSLIISLRKKLVHKISTWKVWKIISYHVYYVESNQHYDLLFWMNTVQWQYVFLHTFLQFYLLNLL